MVDPDHDRASVRSHGRADIDRGPYPGADQGQVVVGSSEDGGRLLLALDRARVGLDPDEVPGAPGTTRTCDLRFRKPTLYPTELRGRSGIVTETGGWPKGPVVPAGSVARGRRTALGVAHHR